MIENLQREELHPMEEAEGDRTLMEQYGLTQEETSQRVGKSRSAVANAMRLLSLCPAVRAMVEKGELSAGHARALLKLPTEEQKLTAIAEIVRQGMSVARTEKYIEALLSKCPETPKKANVGAFLNSLTQSLQKIQLSGIPAVSERRETDSQIVLTITIPK